EDLQADGSFEVVYAKAGEMPFVYKRGNLIIAVNPSDQAASAPVECTLSEVWKIGSATINGNAIEMGPQSFFIGKIG
ncbi:MAG: glycosylase, partial [Butyrivibrio sp.]|nr:glycosylase [Butyrivibrio sp.]